LGLVLSSQNVFAAEVVRNGFSRFLDIIMPILVLFSFGVMLYRPLKEPIDRFFGAIWDIIKKILGGDDEPPGPGEAEYTYEPYYR